MGEFQQNPSGRTSSHIPRTKSGSLQYSASSLVLQLQDMVDAVGNMGASRAPCPPPWMEFKLPPVGPTCVSSPTPWDPQACSPSGLPTPGSGPVQHVPTPDRHHPVLLDRQKEGLLLRQDGRRPGSVEVDDLPFAIPAVPDAGLFRLGRAGDAAGVQVLRDADVGDAGRLVTHQVDVGVQDGGVHRLAVPGPHCRRGREGRRSCTWGPPLTSFPSPLLSNRLSRAPLPASFPEQWVSATGLSYLGVRAQLVDD